MAKTLSNHDRVNLELFVMLDCPYGIDAERILVPLALAFPDKIELKVVYIAEPVNEATAPSKPLECSTAPDSPGFAPPQPSEKSLLQEELAAQILIREYLPDRYLDYLLARLQTPDDVPWPTVAQSVGIQPDMVQLWIQGQEHLPLLATDYERCLEKDIYASPTLFINDREYTGSFSANGLLRQWCEAQSETSAYCNNLPRCFTDLDCPSDTYCTDAGKPSARCIPRPTTPVKLTVLSDRNCRTCVSRQIVDSARYLLPKLILQPVDIQSATGQFLINRLILEQLPVYLFDFSIEEASPVFQSLHSILEKTAFGYLVDPDIHERPLHWKRAEKSGSLEFWFQPGDSASDQAERWWAKQVESGTFPMTPEIHFIVPDATEVLRPRYSLVPSHTMETLKMVRQLTPLQKDLYSRCRRWGIKPEDIIQDNRLRSERDFIKPGGGALLKGQIWFQGWSPTTPARIFYEMNIAPATIRKAS